MNFFKINRDLVNRSSIVCKIPNEDLPYVEKIIDYLQRLKSWIIDYLAKSNTDLGREGPVCPFVPAAIKQDKLLLAYFMYDSKTPVSGIETQCKAVGDYFKTLPYDKFNAIVIVLISREKRDDLAAKFVEQVQKKLKILFYGNGFNDRTVLSGLCFTRDPNNLFMRLAWKNQMKNLSFKQKSVL